MHSRYLERVTSVPWAILPQKGQIISSLIAERLAGHRPSEEEIRARLGHEGHTRPQLEYLAARDGRSRRGQGGPGGPQIAILPIFGTIAHRAGAFELSSGGTSTEWIAATAAMLADDDSVVGVVLDVDSPGGSTEGLQVAADALYRLRQRKPLIAVANSNMASAAYWMASQAREIVVEPGGAVGSIGVLMIVPSYAKHLQKEGIDVNVIRTGRRKIEGNMFEELSAETREHFQRQVDQIGAQFHAAVARGRGVSVERVTKGFGEGRYFLASEAVSHGLANRVATLDQVVRELIDGRRSGGGGGGGTAAAARALELELELLALESRPRPGQVRRHSSPPRLASFVFEGTVAPFNVCGTPQGGGPRVIAPGAFTQYLASGRTPDILVNHDKGQRVTGQIERLAEDFGAEGGLDLRFRPHDTPAARVIRDQARAHGGLIPASIGLDIPRCEFYRDNRWGRADVPASAEVLSRATIDEISFLTGGRGPAFPGALCRLVEGAA